MKYSKIKTWRVKDFRCIGDITLDFTKSPIISLVGDNESGKTSIVKSFGVLGCNAESMSQKGYIRDNTRGFGIACELEDGTVINRTKTDTTNTIDILKENETVYSTDKIDRGYGVPVELEKEMGLLVEPETGELLQVRTYIDNLLFVTTSGSENYKVMYNALKVDNISKAIKSGINESNNISSKVKELESGLNTLRDTVLNIKVLDTESVVKVRDKIKSNLLIKMKLEKLLQLTESVRKLSNKLKFSEELNKTGELDINLALRMENLVSYLNSLGKLEEKVKKLSSVESLHEISLTITDKLGKLVAYSSELNKINLSKYKDLESLSEISLSTADKLRNLVDSVNRLTEVRSSISNYSDLTKLNELKVDSLDKFTKLFSLSEEVNRLRNVIKQKKEEGDKYYSLIKESGLSVTECPNCGSSVVVDLAT